MAEGSRKEIVIATKVTPEVAAIFGRIAERVGVSMYRLFDLMIHSLVKYADDAHSLDPTLQEAVAFFEGFQGWEYASSVASQAGKAVDKGIYMFGARNFEIYFFREMEKRGEVVAMVDVTKYPNEATYNVATIFKTFVSTCFPRLARDLDALCRRENTDSYYRIVRNMVECEMRADTISQDIREMFADNDRAENGTKIQPRKFVAHNNKNSLNELSQLMISFEKDE